jgi:hypothetical protein
MLLKTFNNFSLHVLVNANGKVVLKTSGFVTACRYFISIKSCSETNGWESHYFKDIYKNNILINTLLTLMI